MTKKREPAEVTALKQAMLNVAHAETGLDVARRDRERAIWEAWKAGQTQVALSQVTGMTQPQISKVCARVEAREAVAV